MDEFSINNQAGAYQIHALPGRSRTSSSPATEETPPSQETELMDGFSMDQQAGDYQIHALPGRSRSSSSPATKETPPPPPQETELTDGFSMDQQAGDYQIHALPGRSRTSSSPATKETPPQQETEVVDRFSMDNQAGAYRIMPLPGKATEGAGNPINFNAGEAMGVAYDEMGGGVATMMELNRGIGGGKDVTVTAGGGGGVLIFGEDEEVGQHNFADAEGGSGTTTVDVARMKADATIAGATHAAMKVAKEATDDVVAAGSKLL